MQIIVCSKKKPNMKLKGLYKKEKGEREKISITTKEQKTEKKIVCFK